MKEVVDKTCKAQKLIEFHNSNVNHIISWSETVADIGFLEGVTGYPTRTEGRTGSWENFMFL